jgi:hypothetical protein
VRVASPVRRTVISAWVLEDEQATAGVETGDVADKATVGVGVFVKRMTWAAVIMVFLQEAGHEENRAG